MGPLSGIKVIEFAGIGPGPMAAMQLADMGASVLRIERHQASDLGIEKPLPYNLTLRNRPAIALDLKQPESRALVLEMLDSSDILLEGFRPGVMERLGLGPEQCLQRRPALVYGRITGWGQSGPLAQTAGHDINYIALSGALHAIGRAGHAPTPPLALVGDFGGGAMFLVMGVLAALLHARSTGQGQVVDAAIVEGASSLATTFYGMAAAGQWSPQRGSNILDSGAPHYDCYECSDGRWIAIGPIEARFHAELVTRLGLNSAQIGQPNERDHWPCARAEFARVFRTRTQAQWCELLEGSDVCFSPVLSFVDAPEHHHLRARNSFVQVDGVVQPAPTPRFSATPSAIPSAPEAPSGLLALNRWNPGVDWQRWRHLVEPAN